MRADLRFTQLSGVEVFAGNELLVKGCLETVGGTHLWTGYPGSPVSAFFDIAHDLRELLNAHGIRATMAHNEALGIAMVNGSQMHGLRAIAVQKSVGVHVAADALALGNLAGAHPDGGAVIVLGDDPWSDSTQVPADSRFLAKHLMMPVLEPSDPQELKDWIDVAFRLSRASQLYIGYLVTTHQADGGGTVRTKPNHFPEINTGAQITLETAGFDLERTVLLPPRTWRKEQEMPERVQRLWDAARRLELNRVFFNDQKGRPSGRWGLITSAAAYCYLRHALAELGLDGTIPILKMGLTYPLDPSVILDFCAGKTDVVVVEERRSFLEEQIVHVLHTARQRSEETRDISSVRLWGKQFPGKLQGIPNTRGLNPSRLIELLGNLVLSVPALQEGVDLALIRREVAAIDQLFSVEARLPTRTPTFCPGCPHRDSSSLLGRIKKDFRDPGYMRDVHGIGVVDLVFHGDTGCYTMLMFEPNEDLMHNYSGMGLGGGTGAGIDPFIKNKQVVFMGDSTFFHSGQLAISNSIKNRQDITYIILDNKTTAMTGHQPTPSTSESVTGEETFVQNIERIVSAMASGVNGEAAVVKVNPEEQDTYRRLLEKSILAEGVKVVLADKECGITFHRREARRERADVRERGFLEVKRHINITPEVCENCLECTKATGCPGLTFEATPYGQKVVTDLSWCVADGACVRFKITADGGAGEYKACPSFEEIIVRRERPPVRWVDGLDFDRLPEPAGVSIDGTWYGYLAGVGGMGIGTAAAVLVMAAHKSGLKVQFCDKKGLAIRNGGVFSMLTFSKPGARFTSNIIPCGKADLILGVDLLEAARSLDPAANYCVGSRERTAVVANRHKTPTIRNLIGKEEMDLEEVERFLKSRTRADRFFSHDVSALCERAFGSQIYANMTLLGAAYQKGLLPLQLESIFWGINSSMGLAALENRKAFQLGRWLCENLAQGTAGVSEFGEPLGTEAVLEDKKRILAGAGGLGAARVAEDYGALASETLSQVRLSEDTREGLVRRIYDAVQYGGVDYARRYASLVGRVFARDLASRDHALTRAVIWNLHKVMVIKDEIYVAHLLTSVEKRRRDQARYGLDPARGDRVEYRHFNRPEFVIFGKRVAWDMITRDWMLGWVKRMGWLRKVLPDWHREERDFRDWYIEVLERLDGVNDLSSVYDKWLEFARAPEAVTGYREVRYPKMNAARLRGDKLFSEMARVRLEAEPDMVR